MNEMNRLHLGSNRVESRLFVLQHAFIALRGKCIVLNLMQVDNVQPRIQHFHAALLIIQVSCKRLICDHVGNWGVWLLVLFGLVVASPQQQTFPLGTRIQDSEGIMCGRRLDDV